jgi:hypothetical protein
LGKDSKSVRLGLLVDTKQKSNFVLRLQGRWLSGMRTQLLKTLLKFVVMTQSLIIDLKRMMMRWDSLTFLGGENDAEAEEEEDDEAEEG